MSVRAVFFDVGETLLSEERLWTAWAAHLGVPAHAFFTLLGACIERGEHHRRVFELIRPGFDLEAARRARAAGGDPDLPRIEDLYPDAVPCLAELRRRGYRVGIAGNQPAAAAALLASFGLVADVVASAEEWQVEKPSRCFFERLAEAAQLAPGGIAYVGDRLDNDVIPAVEAGMAGIHLRRGPLGLVHARRADAVRASASIGSLDELGAALALLQGRRGLLGVTSDQP